MTEDPTHQTSTAVFEDMGAKLTSTGTFATKSHNVTITTTTTTAASHNNNCGGNNNNNNECIATQLALDLKALASQQDKASPSRETPAIAASPRPLPEELRYRPHTQDRWRESLNGNYDVTQKSLGEGASGKVILATDRRNGETVAVKVIPKGRLRPDQLERIRREYSIMNQVSHKHLISLMEVVENPHEICIVMEYAVDGDLFSLISGSPHERLDEDEARVVFRQLAKGVRHLHRRNFVHRDIKPENVFMSNGRAILGDFGYGMLYDNVPSTTSVGSLHYASPEVILKESTYIGPEIDVWSLGCVLYAMVCGYTPFQGETVKDTKMAIVRGVVEFPSFLSQEVRSLICNMLHLHVSKRFTMEQVLAHEWTQLEKRTKRRDTVETITSVAAQLCAMQASTGGETTTTSSTASIPTDTAWPKTVDPMSVSWAFDSTPECVAETWSNSTSSSTSSSPTSSGSLPLPLPPREHRASVLRALLPRLPLAKLRMLWQGDKGGRLSPGTLSPTSPSTAPPSPKTSPSSLASSPRPGSPKMGSPKIGSPKLGSPKLSSKAICELRLASQLGGEQRRSTCSDVPSGPPSPSGLAEGSCNRRNTTSPRLVLTSPRKALANFTDKILSPRRERKSSAPVALPPYSVSASIPPVGLYLEVSASPPLSLRSRSPRHVVFSHSDSYAATQVLQEKGKERCDRSSVDSSSSNSSRSSSGEHATFILT